MILNEDYKLHTEDNLENLKLEGVYLIRNLDNNTLKIGVANNLNRRFKEIQKQFKFCGHVPNLRIECLIEYNYPYDLEKYLHNEFNEVNSQNEWFYIDNINDIIIKLDNFEFVKNEAITNFNSTSNKKSKKTELKNSKYEIQLEEIEKYNIENNIINLYRSFWTPLSLETGSNIEIYTKANTCKEARQKTYEKIKELINEKYYEHFVWNDEIFNSSEDDKEKYYREIDKKVSDGEIIEMMEQIDDSDFLIYFENNTNEIVYFNNIERFFNNYNKTNNFYSELKRKQNLENKIKDMENEIKELKKQYDNFEIPTIDFEMLDDNLYKNTI